MGCLSRLDSRLDLERFGSVWIVCQDWIDLKWSTDVEIFGLFIKIGLEARCWERGGRVGTKMGPREFLSPGRRTDSNAMKKHLVLPKPWKPPKTLKKHWPRVTFNRRWASSDDIKNHQVVPNEIQKRKTKNTMALEMDVAPRHKLLVGVQCTTYTV